MSNIYAIHCFYEGDDVHSIELIADKTIPYKVYHLLENGEKGNLLLESEQAKDQFHFPLDHKKRQFFLFENEDEQMMFSHRIIPLKGMYNVRDLGGYLCKNGQRIKWGKILRGDHLINLQESSYEKFLSLEVDTIIDLRSAKEINSHPNPYLNQNATIYCDPNAHTAAFAGILQDIEASSEEDLGLNGSELTKEAAIEQMQQQQRRFVYENDSKRAFARMLRSIASDETKVSYQHCRGGKDRTGYSILLIEEILGLEERLIIEDYMLTKRARAEKNKVYKERFLKLAKGNQELADYLYVHFDTQESFIQAAKDEILSTYPSVTEYIEKELSIDLNLQNKIKNKYLE